MDLREQVAGWVNAKLESLETLSAENARLRAENDQWRRDHAATWQEANEHLRTIARLRADVARLLAAWPSSGVFSPTAVVYEDDAGYWLERVNGEPWKGGNPGPHPTREAAVRAAAGLDAGDGSPGAGPATHGEGEGR